MTAKRINITLQESMAEDMDATAEYYGMNRSEFIAWMFETMQNLDAFWILEQRAIDIYESNNGDAPAGWAPSEYYLTKAAKSCTITQE